MKRVLRYVVAAACVFLCALHSVWGINPCGAESTNECDPCKARDGKNSVLYAELLDQSGSVTNEQATQAVTEAKTAAQSAVAKTSTLVNSIAVVKNKAGTAKTDDVERAKKAKDNAVKLAGTTAAAQEAKKKAETAASTAETKADAAQKTAGQAETKATELNTAATQAQNDANDADGIAATGDDHSAKKQKADTAKKAAEDAEGKIKEAETLISQAETEIGEAAKAADEAEIAESEVKAIVAEDGATKAYDKMQKQSTSATSLKEKVSKHLNDINAMIGAASEDLKAKLENSKTAAAQAEASASGEVSVITQAENDSLQFKKGISEELTKIKTEAVATKAQEAARQAEDKLTKLQLEEGKVTAALTKITTAEQNAEKALLQAKTIVAAHDANKEYENTKTHHANTKAEKEAIDKHLSKITELLGTAPAPLKKKLTALQETVSQASTAAATYVKDAEQAENNAKTHKTTVDEEETNAKGADSLDKARNAANKANEAFENAKKETVKANTALEAVKSETKKATKAKHNAVTTVTVSKIDASAGKAKDYADQSTMKKEAAESAMKAIEASKSGVSSEVIRRVEERLQAAEKAYEKTEVAHRSAKAAFTVIQQKQKEAATAIDKMDEADESASEIKAQQVESIARNTSSEELSAQTALQTVTEEAEKVEQAQHQTMTAIAAANAKASYEAAKQHHTSIVQKKSATDAVVNEINEMLKVAPREVQANVTEQLHIATAAQKVIQDKVTLANKAQSNANTKSGEAEAAFTETEKESTTSVKKEKAGVAQTAAQDANREATSAQTALVEATGAAQKAEAAKTEAQRAIRATEAQTQKNRNKKEQSAPREPLVAQESNPTGTGGDLKGEEISKSNNTDTESAVAGVTEEKKKDETSTPSANDEDSGAEDGETTGETQPPKSAVPSTDGSRYSSLLSNSFTLLIALPVLWNVYYHG